MSSKTKLSDQVIRRIMDLISVQKVYQPGDKLPNEQQLSLDLGVSRTTLREAILYLVTQNVLEIRRGKGTFVSEKSGIMDEFGFDDLKYMHLKLRDLYEIRTILDPQMAYYAALRSTEEELQNILAIGKSLADEAPVLEENTAGNMKFHMAIVRATHNEFAIKLAEIVNAALIEAFKVSKLKQTLYEDTLLDHKMIMDYLSLRDAEGAKQAMYLHMKHSMKDYGIE